MLAESVSLKADTQFIPPLKNEEGCLLDSSLSIFPTLVTYLEEKSLPYILEGTPIAALGDLVGK